MLYGLLFVNLNAADTALLIGSLVLFSMLAEVMILTREVDWYAVGREGNPEAQPGGAS